MAKPILKMYDNEKTYQELFEDYIALIKIQGMAEETIRTYYYHHKYFMKFIGYDIKCNDIDISLLNNYKMMLLDRKLSKVTINSYLSNIRPVLRYGMNNGYISQFIITGVKEEEKIKELYTEAELKILLVKPAINKTSFPVYRNWVIINFLLATGVRAKELRNIKIKDVDFENMLIALQVTKNKKARYIPLSTGISRILTEYMTFRKGKADNYLFCNQFGEQLPRTTLQMSITKYCKRRGVNKYSLDLFRHTFATNYLKYGGDIFTLKRILGHFSMRMVNHHYLQLQTKDLQDNIDKFNPLDNIIKGEKLNLK